ncbi:hypothetical protein MARINON1_60319 [Marinobacter salarius]|nr:hypothetical protein MARINON1_60319 [Marinobacter salarius]
MTGTSFLLVGGNEDSLALMIVLLILAEYLALVSEIVGEMVEELKDDGHFFVTETLGHTIVQFRDQRFGALDFLAPDIGEIQAGCTAIPVTGASLQQALVLHPPGQPRQRGTVQVQAVGQVLQQTPLVTRNQQQSPHLGDRNTQRFFAALVSVFVYSMAGLVQEIEKPFIH